MKNYRDDYCQQVNDGFGCNDDKHFGLDYCLECQEERLKVLLETYHNLKKITKSNK